MKIYYFFAIFIALFYIYLNTTKNYSENSYIKPDYGEKVAQLKFSLPQNFIEIFEKGDKNWGLKESKKEISQIKNKEIKKEISKYTQPDDKTICVLKKCFNFLAMFNEDNTQFALFYLDNEDEKIIFKKLKENEYLDINLKIIQMNKKSIKVLDTEKSVEYLIDTGYIKQENYQNSK